MIVGSIAHPTKPRRFSPRLTKAGITPILLSVPDAAECMGISSRTLYSMIENHELPTGAVTFLRGRIRIVYSVLARHYEQQSI